MQNFKAGFMIMVKSWENDGDKYNTKILDGLTENQVKFYKEVFNFFASKSNRDDKINLGNIMHDEYETVIRGYGKTGSEMIAEAGRKIIDSANKYNIELQYDINNIDETDEEILCDFVSELSYNFLGSSEYYAFRVFESAKVAHITNQISFKDIKEF